MSLRDLARNSSPSSQHDRITENDVTDESSQELTDFAFNEVQNVVSNSVDVLPHCDSEVVNDNGHKDNQLPESNFLIPNHCVARHESGNLWNVTEIQCIIDVFHVYPT